MRKRAFIELCENFIYQKINIFTGGAYAPYAPCMGTPLADDDDNDDYDDEYDNFYGAITQHMPLQGRLHKKLVACHRYDFSK